jgi:AraC-like DNA-binding protein
MSRLSKAIEASITARGRDGFYASGFPGLSLARASTPSQPMHMVYVPSLCVVAQGAKSVFVSDKRYDYAADQYLLVAIELPIQGLVTEATPHAPYLGLVQTLDVGLLCEVIEQLPAPRSKSVRPTGIFVGELRNNLADVVRRLVELERDHTASKVLAPAIMRELSYHLLVGPHGNAVRRIALASGATQRIAKAIAAVRRDLAQPIRVGDLAAIANMSPSSFHQHFGELTAMTPIQYQKTLRLLEARRLLIAEDVLVSEAAHRVGYGSPSQFSREYARMFGAPPHRDIAAAQ